MCHTVNKIIVILLHMPFPASVPGSLLKRSQQLSRQYMFDEVQQPRYVCKQVVAPSDYKVVNPMNLLLSFREDQEFPC